jgi:hypothetical protein
MKFLPYETAYNAMKKLAKTKGIANLSMDEAVKLVAEYCNDMNSSPFERMRFISEFWWIDDQKPYYKLYPSILEPANRLKLCNIPANMLTMPGHLKTTSLWLPERNRIQNILVSRLHPTKLLFTIRADVADQQYVFFVFNTEQERSIDEVIELSKFECDRFVNIIEVNQNEIIRSAVRYFAMAKFLTDCPNEDLMTYDLPGRYIREWGQAPTKRKKEILKWSRNHGHNGFNIGLHHRIFENAGRLSEERIHAGTGTEQEYAHIRTGHLHAVRFGAEKRHVKLMWFMPMVVNKGKPFKVENGPTEEASGNPA